MSKLEAIVKRAEENGHTMQDVSVPMPATGVFAQCTVCGASLRYYKQHPMGEAYKSRCSGIRGTHPPMVFPTQKAPPNQIWSDEELAAMKAEKYEGYTLNDWRDEFLDYARKKGWQTEPDPDKIPTLVALMHSELSELLEEYRDGHAATETHYDPMYPGKPHGIPSEIGDLVIRALHFAGIYGIDIDAIVIEKHEYNLTREYRHGGKVI